MLRTLRILNVYFCRQLLAHCGTFRRLQSASQLRNTLPLVSHIESEKLLGFAQSLGADASNR